MWLDIYYTARIGFDSRCGHKSLLSLREKMANIRVVFPHNYTPPIERSQPALICRPPLPRKSRELQLMDNTREEVDENKYGCQDDVCPVTAVSATIVK